MIVECVLASPGQDVPLGPTEKALPFKTGPGVDHPFLTLQDYFQVVETSLSEDGYAALMDALARRLNRKVPFEDIRRIVIRSEKHGALYHLAAIEILVQGQETTRFAISTALSEVGIEYAEREFRTLKTLQETFDYPYLPKVHFYKNRASQIRGRRVPSSHLLCDWLDDFHEWHLARTSDGSHRASVWYPGGARHLAGEADTRSLFRQAARILTLYYDMKTSRRIHPIHHAAGDFVVKSGKTGVQVKLTTARNYSPLVPRPEGEQEVHPFPTLFYFLLDLTLRMRLDREEGILEPIWAGVFSLEETIQGFLEGLSAKEEEGRLGPGQAGGFKALLRTFSHPEMQTVFHPLLEVYRHSQPGEVVLIEQNIEAHIRDLHRIIQTLR